MTGRWNDRQMDKQKTSPYHINPVKYQTLIKDLNINDGTICLFFTNIDFE